MMLVRLVIFMIFIVCSNLYSQQGNLDDFDMDYLSADDKNDFDFDISDYLLYDNENDFDSKLYRINSYAEFSGLYKLSNVDLIVDRVILKINLDEIKEYYNENSKKYSDNSEYQDTWLYNYFSENIRIVLTRYSEWVSFFYLYIYARDKDKAFKVLETVYNLNFYLGQLLNKYDRNKFERNLKRLFVEEHYKNPEIFLLTNSQEIKIKGIEKIENNVSHRHILQELNKNEIFKELNDPFMLTDNVKEMIKDYLDNIIINNNIKNLNDISEVDRIYYVYDFLMEKMNLKKSYDFKETTSKFYQGAYDLCLEYEKDGYCTGDCLSALFIYLAVAREMGLLINIAKVVKTSDNIYTGNHFAGVVYLKELKEYITLDIGLTIIGNREKDIIIETDRDALLYNAVYILNDNKFDKRDLFNIITKSYNENNPFILDHYIRVIPTNKEVNSHSEYLIKLINSRIEKIKNHNDQNFNLALYYYYLSLIYYKYERYEESNMYIDMSLNYDSNIMESYKLKGDLCYRLEKHREAINYYRKFVDYENIDSIDKIIEVYYKIAWIYACSLNDKIKFNEIIDEAFKLQRNKKYHLTWSDITVFINYTYVEIPGCSLLIYDDKGALSNIYLSTPIKLNNLLIDKGDYIIKKSISLYDNGYLKYGYLAEDFSIKVGDSELMLKSGEMIAFYETGEINNGCLAGNQEIMVGKNKIKLKSNAKNGKYDIGLCQNGNINYGYLAEDCPIKIGDSELNLKSGEGIGFYETGNINYGYLAENFPIKIGDSELNLKSGEGIGFYETGNISYGYLAEDFPIKIGDSELMLKSGEMIRFYETGNISYGYLAEDFPIKIGDSELMLKSGEIITFYETGNVSAGYLAEDCPIKIGDNELMLKSGEIIQFYENGAINVANLTQSKSIVLNGLKYEFSSLNFYPNGKIEGGIVEKPVNIKSGDNILFISGWLSFNELGFITEGYLSGEQNIKINNLLFKTKDGAPIEFFNDGSIRVVNTEDYLLNINNYSFTTNKVKFNQSGEITSANISKPSEIKLNSISYKIPENAKIEFYKEGILKSIIYPENIKIEYNNSNISIKSYCPLAFYKSGKIQSVYLSENSKINLNGKDADINNKDTFVSFHENGNIESISLKYNQEFEIKNKKYNFVFENVENQKTYRINFFNNGMVKDGYLANETNININENIFIAPVNTKISFYENGNVECFNIAKNTFYVENIPISSENISDKPDITLYEDGSIKSVYAVNDFDRIVKNTIYKFRGGNTIEFYKNGIVKNGCINEENSINLNGDIIYIKSNKNVNFDIGFSEDGTISFAYLNNDQKIKIGNNFFNIYDNCYVDFYSTGNIQHLEKIDIKSIKVGAKSFDFIGDYTEPSSVIFYENGNIAALSGVKEGELKIGQNKIKYHSIPGNYTISFYESGEVEAIFSLKGKQNIKIGQNKIIIKGNKDMWSIDFHKNGSVRSVISGEDQNILINKKNIKVKENQILYFDLRGNFL